MANLGLERIVILLVWLIPVVALMSVAQGTIEKPEPVIELVDSD